MFAQHWAKVMHTWETWQVELHGKYSVERMHNLRQHSQSTSHVHALLVIFLTPLPCLACVVLCDLIPLEAPKKGVEHSHIFWLRAFLITWLLAFTVMEQCRHFIPALPMTHKQNAVVTVITAVGSAASGFGVSCVIGYPLPFTLCLMSPVAIVLLLTLSALVWGEHVRENPTLRPEILNYALIVVAQTAVAYAYPAYNSVFIGLPPSYQTPFALLLPVIKILAKNWIAFLIRNMEDFKPEFVIFNVEVFHALFLTYCMQQSNSVSTTFLLVALDFVQACASLWDVDLMLQSLHELLYGTVDGLVAKNRSRAQAKQVVPSASNVGSAPGEINLLDAAMYILSIDHKLRSSPIFRLVSHQVKNSRLFILKPREGERRAGSIFSRANRGQEYGPQEMTTIKTQHQNQRVTAVPLSSESHHGSHSLEMALDAFSQATNLSEDNKKRLETMSQEQRIQLVQQVLQLLHCAEFLLLVEFTEVIIPGIYCVYLGAISHLPNRHYYTNLRGLDSASLRHSVMNVVIYASLEAVSFIMLAALLSRRLKISPLKQLSFVLEKQWQSVQAKLILWVVFIVQMSLDHFGFDYSFKFAWLHKTTN